MHTLMMMPQESVMRFQITEPKYSTKHALELDMLLKLINTVSIYNRYILDCFITLCRLQHACCYDGVSALCHGCSQLLSVISCRLVELQSWCCIKYADTCTAASCLQGWSKIACCMWCWISCPTCFHVLLVVSLAVIFDSGQFSVM